MTVDDANANADNIMYALQSSLERKEKNLMIILLLTFMYMIDIMTPQLKINIILNHIPSKVKEN